jgi:uncharacterized delta-60 repeat protein
MLMKKPNLLINSLIVGAFLLQLVTFCISSRGAAGDVDLSFDPGSCVNGSVNTIKVQPDGKLIIGGEFTTIKGLARHGVARLNADGSGDSSFFYEAPSYGGTYPVHSLALQADGKLLVGGEVYNFGFIRVNIDGTPDTSFNENASAAIAPFAYYGAAVNTIAVQPDGKIFYAGDGVLRLNSDGTLDSTFIAAEYGVIYAIALQPDGKVIVSGYFEYGPSGPGYALMRLNSNGDLDNSFVRTPDILVLSLALQQDGRILARGPHAGGTYRHVIGLHDHRIIATFDRGTSRQAA